MCLLVAIVFCCVVLSHSLVTTPFSSSSLTPYLFLSLYLFPCRALLPVAQFNPRRFVRSRLLRFRRRRRRRQQQRALPLRCCWSSAFSTTSARGTSLGTSVPWRLLLRSQAGEHCRLPTSDPSPLVCSSLPL